MQKQEIRQKIKEIIADVANLSVDDIPDEAHLVEDLDLDSLSLMEIGVDVDYAFQLGLPDERLREMATMEKAVSLVQSELAARETASEVA